MSFNVLVIPEDFRKDQHILKPVVQAILSAAGKPNATLRVCQNPLLGGTGQALESRIRGFPSQSLGQPWTFRTCPRIISFALFGRRGIMSAMF